MTENEALNNTLNILHIYLFIFLLACLIKVNSEYLVFVVYSRTMFIISYQLQLT
jgi:uncharacterized membrane protein